MAEALALQAEHTSHEQREIQRRYDLQTQFAELVDGNMRTDFELIFTGDDLIGEDGRSMRATTADALEDAKEIAKVRPEFWFEVRRRSFEQEEIEEAIRMAKGEGPNTMIIISDFPAELMNATEDVGGYNVRRKQAMNRTLTRKPNGNIRMRSQSLDGSNRTGLEAIYDHFGIKPEPGELLPQRIRIDLTEQEQEYLVDESTGIHDRSLTNQFGGEWYAGRHPADYSNTYDFVCAQNDLIEEGIRLQDLGWLTDEIMYGMAATMQNRFEAAQNGSNANIVTSVNQPEHNLTILYQEIRLAGNQARQMGLSFSACGVTLKAEGSDNSSENQLGLAGFGNKSIEKDCNYISEECPICGEEDVETTVHTLIDGRKEVSGSCGCKKIYAKMDD